MHVDHMQVGNNMSVRSQSAQKGQSRGNVFPLRKKDSFQSDVYAVPQVVTREEVKNGNDLEINNYSVNQTALKAILRVEPYLWPRQIYHLLYK